MDKIVDNATGLMMAVVGVAILYTLVNPNNKTAQVLNAGFSGFAGTLNAAMGGQVSRSPIMG